MNKISILTLIALATAFAGLTYHITNNMNEKTYKLRNSEVYEQWVAWKAQYGKQYQLSEQAFRYAIFTSNYQLIQTHNAQKHSFTLGLNQFADLSNPEFASYVKKGLLSTRKFDDDKVKVAPTSCTLKSGAPAAWDWRTKGAVTPVKDQGQCGSCWAFSTTGSVEGLCFLEQGKLYSLSEQNLVDCSQAQGNQGCNGGWMDWGFTYIKLNGIELESSYPYTATTDTCAYSAAKKSKCTVAGFCDVPVNTPATLKEAVYQQPVSVAIEADQSVFQLYKSGVMDSASCGTQLDHGVLVVGYGTSAGKNYWIVKNSWAATWGNEGYIWIADTTGAGTCGINSKASYPYA